MNRQGMIRVSVYENSHQLILSIYDNGRVCHSMIQLIPS